MYKKTRLYIDLKYIYYHLQSELKFMISPHQLEYQIKEKNIYLFMTADYGNLGDVAISLSEIKFFKEKFSQYNIVEIPFGSSFNELKYIKKNMKKDDIIAIVGGGNMTNRFETFEIVRRIICRKFKNNIIVFFPQTADYTDDYFGRKSKKITIKYINKVKKKLFSVREANTYKYLKEEIKGIYLSPDIVMYNIGNNKRRKKKRENVGFCLRTDSERDEKNNNVILSIRNYFRKDPKEIFDTHLGDENFDIAKREEKVNELLEKIANLKIVVTDRLHCMIFCCITGTPCIVLDNANNKIKNVYNTWLMSFRNILFVSSEQDVNDKTIQKLYSSEVENDFDKEFCEFAKKINELIEEKN